MRKIVNVTQALQLSVFDQTLSEISAVEKFADALSGCWSTVDRALKITHLVGRQAHFLSRFAQTWDPDTLSTTDDVLDAAEQLEPHFYRFYAALRAFKKPPAAHIGSPTSVFGADIGLRLAYVRDLTSQLTATGRGRVLSPSENRNLEQRLLDDASVPPEVRLVVQQDRCLPVLLVFVYFLKVSPKFGDDKTRDLVHDSIRGCLDSMLSLLLGECDRKGLRPVPPPESLVSELPDPMPIQEIEERWRVVQSAWSK